MEHSSPTRPHRNKSPNIESSVYLDPSAVVIGDVSIGADSSVWPGAVIRGDMHFIKIGERSSVQDNAVLHITHASAYNPDGWPLIIGNEVTIGHSAVLHGCKIGDRVLIGIGSIILDGAEIPNDVVIAAATLVPPGKKLESGYMYMGQPCRKARALTESEREFFSYSAQNYVNLKQDYLARE